MTVRRRRAVAMGVLAVLVVVAGAIFLDTYGATGGRDIEERYAAVEDYTGRMTVETVVTRPERGVVAERRTVADVRYRRPDRYRYDYRRSPPEDPNLVTLVVEGDVATRYERDGDVTQLPTHRLGVATLGVRYRDLLRNFSMRYGVAPNGTATVAGRRARVVELEPRDGVEPAVDRLWLDRETGMPVRLRLRRRTGDRTVTTTVTYSDVAFDVGVPRTAFRVEGEAAPGSTG